MKHILFTFALLMVFSVTSFAQADKIVGRWKTIDDKDGSAKSIVLIFKATNGQYYGKIDKMFKDPEKLCVECQGPNKNKIILGMMIINNLVEKDGKLSGGTILDPKNGKVYKCNISLEGGNDKLNVRGSLDKSGWIGRSQTWIRVK
ncbi:MAG: DUF2147 domain-containing protein [Paludibacter sp.]|nr:DUF2147 domain-containing protein [Paludibacter sp.]